MGLTSVCTGEDLSHVRLCRERSIFCTLHTFHLPLPPSKKRHAPCQRARLQCGEKKMVKNELSQPLGVNIHSSCFPRKASQCCCLIRTSGVLAIMTERLAPKCDEGTSLSDSSTRFIPRWKEKAWDYQACPISRWGVPQENSVTVPGRLGFLAQFFPLANSFLWWRYCQHHGDL